MLNSKIQEYLDYCRYSRKSPKTIRNYCHYLKRFLEFSGDIDIASLDLKIINKFKAYLYGQNLSSNTQNYHLIAIRAFLWYCLKHDIETLYPQKIDLLKHEKPIMDYLTGAEIKKFFKAIQTETVLGKRDMALLSTLYTGALRVSELISINRSQIDLKFGEIAIKGKGGRPRTIFINKDTINAIKTYLDTRKDQHIPIFISYRNQGKDHRISSVMVEQIVRKYALKANIHKKVTPHVLRRSFATGLIINGAPISGVQEILGHAWITTTQIYTNLSRPDLKKIHEEHIQNFI